MDVPQQRSRARQRILHLGSRREVPIIVRVEAVSLLHQVYQSFDATLESGVEFGDPLQAHAGQLYAFLNCRHGAQGNDLRRLPHTL